MMSGTIKFEITFHSLWHCGSGESKGADIDNLVIKDHYGFPYIPGKTLKGLTRDALYDLIDAGVSFDSDQVDRLFGKEPDKNVCKPAEAFFESAYLSHELRSNILSENLVSELYTKVSQTAIDEFSGTAKDKSLRSIEMAIPLTLYSSVRDVSDEDKSLLNDLFSMIKRMGTGRNRGYGRCSIKIAEGGVK